MAFERNITAANDSTTILYRPIGQKEFDLIARSDYRAFPPRLPWQPIFYPVLNQEYATQISRGWNTRDVENGSVGYVTRFLVNSEYLSHFEIHQVGGAEHLEYWIPAEELTNFNHHIQGRIEMVAEFRGDAPLTAGSPD